MKIQNYKHGEIHKLDNVRLPVPQYSFVVDGETKGLYWSIEELVSDVNRPAKKKISKKRK